MTTTIRTQADIDALYEEHARLVADIEREAAGPFWPTATLVEVNESDRNHGRLAAAWSRAAERNEMKTSAKLRANLAVLACKCCGVRPATVGARSDAASRNELATAIEALPPVLIGPGSTDATENARTIGGAK